MVPDGADEGSANTIICKFVLVANGNELLQNSKKDTVPLWLELWSKVFHKPELFSAKLVFSFYILKENKCYFVSMDFLLNFAKNIIMRIAFIITAHNDPVHLKRMTDALPESSEFFVHVDAKSDIEPFLKLIDNPRVHFTKKRINVMWGSLGVVDSQMQAIGEALVSGKEYDYFISLSGLDYPLWSNRKIEEFLQSHKGTNFIYGVDMDKQGKESKLYRQYRFFNCKYWRYKTLKSKFRVSLREINSVAFVLL